MIAKLANETNASFQFTDFSDAFTNIIFILVGNQFVLKAYH